MATQHLGTDYSNSLTSVLDSAEHSWFLFFFPQNVLWKLTHLEGEIVFDRFCELGFHRVALLNGPGASGATEERAAECFWKAMGGK